MSFKPGGVSIHRGVTDSPAATIKKASIPAISLIRPPSRSAQSHHNGHVNHAVLHHQQRLLRRFLAAAQTPTALIQLQLQRKPRRPKTQPSPPFLRTLPQPQVSSTCPFCPARAL